MSLVTVDTLFAGASTDNLRALADELEDALCTGRITDHGHLLRAYACDLRLELVRRSEQ